MTDGPAPDDLPRRADVLVVGAGLAGLAAARELRDLDVHVVEAADAVGGRVRTDEVDGFLCDRGFQVLSTAYPAVRAQLDLDALALGRFERGALLHIDGETHRIVDPRRRPLGARGFVTAPLGSLPERLRLAAWAAYAGFAPVSRLRREEDRSARDALAGRGLGRTIDRIVSPFFAGVILERELSTSARFVDLVMRTFVRGDSTLPARGMRAVPEQLAGAVGHDRIHLGTRVASLTLGAGGDRHRVTTDDGRTIEADAVVVAVDMDTACDLGAATSADTRRWKSVITFHHACDEPPTDEALLLIDGDGGLVANSAVVTNATPTYAPPGRALVATSVVAPTGERLDPAEVLPAVTARLSELWRTDASRWDLVTTHPVVRALPAFDPPATFRRSVVIGAPGDRAVRCGDYLDTPSIQGALVSGRRAAQALRAAIGQRPGTPPVIEGC